MKNYSRDLPCRELPKTGDLFFVNTAFKPYIASVFDSMCVDSNEWSTMDVAVPDYAMHDFTMIVGEPVVVLRSGWSLYIAKDTSVATTHHVWLLVSTARAVCCVNLLWMMSHDDRDNYLTKLKDLRAHGMRGRPRTVVI